MTDEMKEAMRNWHKLNHRIALFDEDQLLEMLEAEKQGRCRPDFLERLHARYYSLRVARERIALLELAK